MKKALKNILMFIAYIPLLIILCTVLAAGFSAWIWLPILMNHWSGIVIGVVALIGTQISYDKFIRDN